jgi:SAM-dependent methyltransferase
MNVGNPGSALRSNVDYWKQLQENDYFEKHPCYNGLRDLGDSTCAVIEQYLPLSPGMNVVVVGCGYGRDTAHIAPRVRHVWGTDVSSTILDKAERYLGELGITNFTPVLAEDYGRAIPDGIDLVFSIVVMQHLTRDLVRDYFRTLGSKLTPSGRMLVQFVEDFLSTDEDAQLRAYEPSISWTSRQLLELAQDAGVRFIEVRTQQVTPTALWHWGLFGAAEAPGAALPPAA